MSEGEEPRVIVRTADIAALVEFMGRPLAMPVDAKIGDWLADPGFKEACAAAGRLKAALPVPFAGVEERLRAALGPHMRVEEITRFDGVSVLARGHLATPDAAGLEGALEAAGNAGLPVWSWSWDGMQRTKGEWAAWRALGPSAPVPGLVTLQVLKETEDG